MHEAFKGINESHGFENTDFPTVEVGCQVAEFYICNPLYYGVVAEIGGRIVGVNFLDERNSIRGVATVSVDPDVQGEGVGRKLMEAVLKRSRSSPDVRLLQHAFNTLSMVLYTSLGFEVKEHIMFVSGRPKSKPYTGVEVRRMQGEDLDECGALCKRVHGFQRTNELTDALKIFTPFVGLREHRVVAYASAADTWAQNHGVAESEEDMRALILGIGASMSEPLSFLLPIRQTSFFRWCLDQGLRVVKPMTLMAMGEYQEPKGCYFTSVVY
jgi:GNAT superfamily N-acetyltransferase